MITVLYCTHLGGFICNLLYSYGEVPDVPTEGDNVPGAVGPPGQAVSERGECDPVGNAEAARVQHTLQTTLLGN